MHFTTISLLSLTSLPTLISAITLAQLSPITDSQISIKCQSQYAIPLMSCGKLPGFCADSCKEQLNALEDGLAVTCKDAKDPQGLLLAALNGQLVRVLCTDGGSDDGSSSGGELQPSPTPEPAPSSSTRRTGGGGAVASQTTLSPSTFREIQASTATAPAEPTRTGGGIIIDTSAVDTPLKPTDTGAGYTPEYTRSPTTTGSGAKSTQNSESGSSGGSNGSLFESQDSGAQLIRGSVVAVLMGLIVGVLNVV